jgi:hypothetical protein
MLAEIVSLRAHPRAELVEGPTLYSESEMKANSETLGQRAELSSELLRN